MKVTQVASAPPANKVYKKIEEYTNEENGLYIIDGTVHGWNNHNNYVVFVSGYDSNSRRATLLIKPDTDWSACSRVPMRKATAEEVFQISNG